MTAEAAAPQSLPLAGTAGYPAEKEGCDGGGVQLSLGAAVPPLAACRPEAVDPAATAATNANEVLEELQTLDPAIQTALLAEFLQQQAATQEIDAVKAQVEEGSAALRELMVEAEKSRMQRDFALKEQLNALREELALRDARLETFRMQQDARSAEMIAETKALVDNLNTSKAELRRVQTKVQDLERKASAVQAARETEQLSLELAKRFAKASAEQQEDDEKTERPVVLAEEAHSADLPSRPEKEEQGSELTPNEAATGEKPALGLTTTGLPLSSPDNFTQP